MHEQITVCLEAHVMKHLMWKQTGTEPGIIVRMFVFGEVSGFINFVLASVQPKRQSFTFGHTSSSFPVLKYWSAIGVEARI